MKLSNIMLKRYALQTLVLCACVGANIAIIRSKNISVADIKQHGHELKDNIEIKAQLAKQTLLAVPYSDMIHSASEKFDLDSKLIASIIFVESTFKEKAKSYAGAKGLMQIMPVVAKQYKVKNAYDPKQNILAGTEHFTSWMKIIEAETQEDLVKMTLSAYNAGLGHLRDAQRLAIRKNLSPHRWENISKMFLLLEKKSYYKKARYGFCRGKDVNKYVNKVYKTYKSFQNNLFAGLLS